MNADHHRIRAQTVELKLSQSEGAYALQESVRRLLLDKGGPAMDEVLSAFADSDEFILLERLELNLGSLSATQLESELVGRLCGQLRKALSHEVPQARAQELASPEGKVMRLAASRIESLRHFLQTGQFPWWGRQSFRSDPESLFFDVIEESPPALLAMLRNSSTPMTIKRLARQFSVTALQRLAALLAGDGGGTVQDCIADWVRLLAEDSGIHAAAENPSVYVYEKAINCLLASLEPAGAQEISQNIFADLAESLSLDSNTLAQRLATRAQETLHRSSALRIWLQHLDSYDRPAGFQERSGQRPLNAQLPGKPTDNLHPVPGAPQKYPGEPPPDEPTAPRPKETAALPGPVPGDSQASPAGLPRQPASTQPGESSGVADGFKAKSIPVLSEPISHPSEAAGQPAEGSARRLPPSDSASAPQAVPPARQADGLTQPMSAPGLNTVEISRHSNSMDRRNQDCMDASEPRHPWSLGSGDPCRGDGENLNSTALTPGLESRDGASGLEASRLPHGETGMREGEPGKKGPHPTRASHPGSALGEPATRRKPNDPPGRVSPCETLRIGGKEPVYIENAGLVLLWPFLPRYFQAIGLTQDRCFVSPAN
ncbi:MAG: contractile injection system tape measure protein, partial [Candidatus Methylumidiphilus sp.]